MAKDLGNTKTPFYDSLSPQRKRFVDNYVSQDYLGKGTASYAEAFGYDTTNKKQMISAKSAASRLLGDPAVYKAINEKLTLDGFNDHNVDKQLLHLIEQHADKQSKLGAIREYNKLKKRVEGVADPLLENGINLNIKIIGDEGDQDAANARDTAKAARGIIKDL